MKNSPPSGVAEDQRRRIFLIERCRPRKTMRLASRARSFPAVRSYDDRRHAGQAGQVSAKDVRRRRRQFWVQGPTLCLSEEIILDGKIGGNGNAPPLAAESISAVCSSAMFDLFSISMSWHHWCLTLCRSQHDVFRRSTLVQGNKLVLEDQVTPSSRILRMMQPGLSML